MATFVKETQHAPEGPFALEAAGLAWLAEGGVPCVHVLEARRERLTLDLPTAVRPTAEAAADFGRRLVSTHGAGAPAFGAGPPDWDGDGFFGPLQQPLTLSLNRYERWGEFFVAARLAPIINRAAAAGLLKEPDREMLDRVRARVAAGDYDDGESQARLHGDLWSGNVFWTAGGATLIDPVAHGGHRETHLGMPALFGLPHLDTVLDAYAQVYPLRSGWRQRTGLHQLYPLLVHAVLFGGSYLDQALRAAEPYA